jgi:hypothetical protein
MACSHQHTRFKYTANVVCAIPEQTYRFAHVYDEHPSGVIPSAANGVANVVSGTAKMTSQSVDDVTPAPTAGPLSTANSGLHLRAGLQDGIQIGQPSRGLHLTGSQK